MLRRARTAVRWILWKVEGLLDAVYDWIFGPDEDSESQDEKLEETPF